MSNRRLTVRILSSELGISKKTVHLIFTDDVLMDKVVQSGAEASVWRSIIQFDVSFDVVR